MNVRTLLTSRRITNMFGAVGYSVLLVSYAVVVGVVLVWLLGGGASGVAPVEDPVVTLVDQSDPQQTSILMSMVAYIIMIIMLCTVVFVLITLPYWLGKSGSYILKCIIRLFNISVTPLTLLLAKVIANGMVIVPVLLLAAEDIGNIVTLIFVSGLMGMTLVLFLLQHYLARMNHLQAKDIW